MEFENINYSEKPFSTKGIKKFLKAREQFEIKEY
jgi:hypothetical protein